MIVPGDQAHRFLIDDRDTIYAEGVDRTVATTGLTVLKTPIRAPQANAFAERFVRTIKESCLNRMILFGERSLRRAVREFVAHYHHERNHQGLGNRLIFPVMAWTQGDRHVVCRERLGGLLKYYHRPAP